MPPADGRDAEFHTGALRRGRRLLRIHEEDPQVGLLPFATQQRVHPVGFLDREPVRDQGLDPEPWGQGEERSHVSLEGPADVLVRVVDSLLLVVAIVAAGPVRTRDHEPKLLLVEDPPVEIQPDVPQDHDSPPPARDLGGDRHRGCILGGRRDDDRVDTAPVRPLCDCARERGRVAGHDVAAELARERRPPLDRIQTEHLTSGGLQELHCQLPQEAEADDGNALPETGARETRGMERHGADGREGGLLGGDARRNSGDHVAGDEVVLGVGGIATAGTGHERPDGMLAGTVFLHDARTAVAEGLGRLEPRANGTLGLPDSVPPDLLEDLDEHIESLIEAGEVALLRPAHQPAANSAASMAIQTT